MPRFPPVVLAVHGVLCVGRRFSAQLANRLRLPKTALDPFFRGEYDLALVGRADLRDILPKHLRSWGIDAPIDSVLADWVRCECEIDPKVAAFLQDALGEGVQVVLIGNMDSCLADRFRRHLAQAGLSVSIFLSHELGYVKPDPAFFSSLSERLVTGGAPRYFDVCPRCIKATRALGWAAEVYTHAEALRGPVAFPPRPVVETGQPVEEP